MRWRATVLVLAMCAAMPACGDDGSSGASTLTAEQLQTRLLTVTDAGAGWQQAGPVGEADFDDAGQIPCENMALNPTIRDRLRPVTGVQFEPADTSSKHLIEFAVSEDPDRLRADLDARFGAMDACVKAPAGTGSGAVQLTTFDVPKVGDQRAGYRMVATVAPDNVWLVRTATVRVGARAITLGLTEIVPTPTATPTIGDADFRRLVETAAKKVGA
jgi:hypothetical protein